MEFEFWNEHWDYSNKRKAIHLLKDSMDAIQTELDFLIYNEKFLNEEGLFLKQIKEKLDNIDLFIRDIESEKDGLSDRRIKTYYDFLYGFSKKCGWPFDYEEERLEVVAEAFHKNQEKFNLLPWCKRNEQY